MTTYYVDTSALVKRYVDEIGSGWLRTVLGAQPAPSVIIVHLAVVEMTSALMRRLREGALAPAEVAQLQNAFRSDCLDEYEIALAIGHIINRANRLLEAYPLRAYDAVHMATAVVANQRLVNHDLAPLTFLSSDNRLNEVASAEGLAVDNPNHHP